MYFSYSDFRLKNMRIEKGFFEGGGRLPGGKVVTTEGDRKRL